jgi:thiosulfate/3-mercaptopyruvate sulfurtransferase
MLCRKRSGSSPRWIWCSASVLLTLVIFSAGSPRALAQAEPRADSPAFSRSQLVYPADLLRELTSSNPAAHPTILYVGFRTLFAGGHIPGATFQGTASTEHGLADIKNWAAALPRTTNLVIYCGCCPFERCPNVHPAFALLREMGFTHVRVLRLPTNFASDWVDKNYPVEKGAS